MKNETNHFSRAKKIISLVSFGFLLLVFFSFLDEVLDLAHVFFNSLRTPLNWNEVIIEVFFICIVSVIVIYILKKLINKQVAFENELHKKPQEYQSLNEEYLSQNEELKTINEEYAAQNEELTEEVERRRKTEEALLESERFSRLIVSEVKDYAIFMLNPEGIISSWNEGAQFIKGYTSEEIIGKHFSCFYTKEDIKNKKPKRELKIAAQEGRFEDEGWRVKKDGSTFWASVIITALRDDSGELIGFSKITRDMTEHKQVEDSLQESELRYRRLFESAKDGILIIDAGSGKILDANPFIQNLLDYNLKELVNKEIWEISLLKDIMANKQKFEQLLRDKYVRYDNLPLETKRGKVTNVEFVSNIYLVNNHKIIQCNIRDITDRNRAEEALKELRERLNAFMNAATENFGIYDSKLNLIEINKVGLSMWPKGTKKEDLIGKNVTELVPNIKKNGRYEMYMDVIKTGNPLCLDDFVSHRKFGDMYLEVKAFKVGEGFGMITTDITGRKQAEKKLKDYSERLEELVEGRTKKLIDMQDELIRKERLAALGQFSGSISHELRNPLGVIDSSIYYLKMKLKDYDGKIKEHLERIKNSVDNSSAIVQSLLNLTQMKKPDASKHDLTSIVSDGINTCKIPPDIKVKKEFVKGAIMVNAEKEQLRMAFKNIIKNAIEVMEGKGSLTISIGKPKKDQAKLSFKNTGKPIPQEDLNKIFQPLYSTKTHGIGFGLSITKMIIENHNGSIHVDSVKDKGTKFIVYLPLYDESKGKNYNENKS